MSEQVVTTAGDLRERLNALYLEWHRVSAQNPEWSSYREGFDDAMSFLGDRQDEWDRLLDSGQWDDPAWNAF